MNRKQFLIALAALAVLAALGAAVVFSDRSAWTSADSRAGQKAIAGLRLSEVAEIAIRDSSGELHLVRGDGGWGGQERAGFPADTERISPLLVEPPEMKGVQRQPPPQAPPARPEAVVPNEQPAR